MNIRNLATRIIKKLSSSHANAQFPELKAFDASHPCVFALSTGRVGTTLLADMLQLAPSLYAIHQPEPRLFALSYESYMNEGDVAIGRVLDKSIKACRNPIWNRALKTGKGYVETSPQGTFLAQHILNAQPNAKFLILVRDPVDVVISGMRRDWYEGHPNDDCRIIPRNGTEAAEEWAAWSTFEKVSWLWAETNRWILDFATHQSADTTLVLKSENLFNADKASLEALFAFFGVEMPSYNALKLIAKVPVNAQKKGNYLPADSWNNEQRKLFRKQVEGVAERLGYALP